MPGGLSPGTDRELRERAALLEHLAALGASPDQLEGAAVVPLPDFAELVRWWSSLWPSTEAPATG